MYEVREFRFVSNCSYKYSAPPYSQRNPFLPGVTLKYHHDVQRQIERAHSQESVNVFESNQSWLTNRYEISHGEVKNDDFSLHTPNIHTVSAKNIRTDIFFKNFIFNK